jgi:hypothetical protein
MQSSHAIHTLIVLVSLLLSSSVNAFAPSFGVSHATNTRFTTSIYAASPDVDPQEIIGKTITVKGTVNAGYVRSCIKNEVSISA